MQYRNCSETYGQYYPFLISHSQVNQKAYASPMDYFTVRPFVISYGGGLRAETRHNQNVRQFGTAGLSNLMHTDTRLKRHVLGNKASKAYGFPLLLISELKGI